MANDKSNKPDSSGETNNVDYLNDASIDFDERIRGLTSMIQAGKSGMKNDAGHSPVEIIAGMQKRESARSYKR